MGDPDTRRNDKRHSVMTECCLCSVLFMLIVTYAECRYAECRYAECRNAECHDAECCLCLLSLMLSVVMLSAVTLSVVMPSVIMLSVVAPRQEPTIDVKFHSISVI